ncbi:MAG: CoA transferase [Solirubrobacterales bacterium]|nr:CoA transferase [Solirubrobacterales bacterium]HMT05510.1 CoA transferase [Solirubrobacterales bacterium]
MSSGAGNGGLPLSGIRVLDLTRLLPGGFCSQMLHDFGAEVIKVEDTGPGDYIRYAPPLHEVTDPAAGADEGATRSGLYLSLNRGKRSIRLDLKSEEGRQTFHRLVPTADVVLEGFRPGVAARLGVDFKTLGEINPGLVYCSISGYGQDGPARDRAGHDINYLGATGMLAMTGQAGGPPIQPAGQIGDLGGGAMNAAFGILAALIEKGRSGKGQMVDISMTDGAFAWLAMAAGATLADGSGPRRGEVMLAGGIVCYLTYEAADGWISCGALEPKFWRSFCEGSGHPELIEAQFERPGTEAWEKIATVFRERTRAEWKAFNDEHDCCIEPILELDEALESDLFRERGMLVEFEQPGIGPVRQIGSPIRMSRTPAAQASAAPAIGADTRDVLESAGFAAEETERLFEIGAAAGPGDGGSVEFRA